MEERITIKQAYLAMAEYLLEEDRLNNGKPIDIRSVISELHLVGSWESADDSCTQMFEDAVNKVLAGGSVFDFKE